jgi:carboxypeptidase Q
VTLAALVLLGGALAPAAEVSAVAGYRDVAARIIAAARSDRFAWERLAELTDTYGPRLSGSPALEAALRFVAAEMKKDDLESVRLEKALVPRWVRGRESLEIVEPFPSPLAMLGLGMSVGTPASGISAELLVVNSFEELEAKAALARGRIVLYNVEFTQYGETVRYRGAGASRAARHGALAALVRAVGPMGLRTPHTGALRYDEAQPKIPAAAVSAEDANRLQRLSDRGRRVVLKLQMEAQLHAEVESANVIGEIRGRELPGEIVLVGGHMDSWDVGTGAIDDGGGVVAAWEALRVLKKLGLRPRRTLRVVGFTNEENGGRGALAYRDAHRAELPDHVLALESDNGAFKLRGFGLTGPPAAREVAGEILRLLEPLGAGELGDSGGGADIQPLAQAAAAAGSPLPMMSPLVDGSRYFVYHHTPADTVERIDPEDLAGLAAGIAVVAFVVADLPFRFGR